MMLTFSQFLEARGDRKQMRKLGLTRADMHLRRPPRPNPHEIINSEYLVINAPSTAPELILRYNHQIVARDRSFDSNDGRRLGVSVLDGSQSEGQFLRVPIEWLYPATEEEHEHGEWLGKTFFQRKKYIAPNEPRKLEYLDQTNQTIHQILHNARQALQQCNHPHCRGMLEELEDNPLHIATWLIAADMLDEVGFNTTELRKILNV